MRDTATAVAGYILSEVWQVAKELGEPNAILVARIVDQGEDITLTHYNNKGKHDGVIPTLTLETEIKGVTFPVGTGSIESIKPKHHIRGVFYEDDTQLIFGVTNIANADRRHMIAEAAHNTMSQLVETEIAKQEAANVWRRLNS